MKTFAVSMALGAILVSTVAQAADQRPSYIAFKPAAKAATVAAPATPVVAKRKGLAAGATVPIILGIAAAGAAIAVVASSGNNDDNNVSPQ